MEKSIDMAISECKQNIISVLNGANLTLGIMNLILKDIQRDIELQCSQNILKEINELKENKEILEKD